MPTNRKVTTTPDQDTGIAFAYEHADHIRYPTEAEFFEAEANRRVSDPLYVSYLQQTSVSLNKSIASIPTDKRPKARKDIEDAIVANGGTLAPVAPAVPTPPPVTFGAPPRPE